MNVSLGGLPLSKHLTLEPKGAGVGYSQRRLIGGASVVQVDGNVGGQIMVLNSAGHMTIDELAQIRAMQSLGQAVDLVHHRGTYRVLISDTSEMSEDLERADPDADPTLTVSGNITLIEVN